MKTIQKQAQSTSQAFSIGQKAENGRSPQVIASEKLRYWLIVHSLKAYAQHPDMIGCGPKVPGSKHPKDARFADIRKGDKIVYYATGDKVVVGIFEVVSDMEYLESDPQWGEEFVYRIRADLLPPKGEYLDFKALIKDSLLKFDLFPDKKKWALQIWHHTCRPLTKKDFDLIAQQMHRLRIKSQADIDLVKKKLRDRDAEIDRLKVLIREREDQLHRLQSQLKQRDP